MKARLILLFVSFLTLTGCTAQYNLTINEDSVKENVSIKFSNLETTQQLVNIYAREKIPISQSFDETDFYDANVINDSNNYYLNYEYEHSFDTISNSYFATHCYESFNVSNFENYINISTGEMFKCLQMDDSGRIDSAEINITTDLKVTDNNADKVVGDTYTWIIDDTNYKNKPIKMVIQKNFVFDMNGQMKLTLIWSGVVLVVGTIILFMYFRRKKMNTI